MRRSHLLVALALAASALAGACDDAGADDPVNDTSTSGDSVSTGGDTTTTAGDTPSGGDTSDPDAVTGRSGLFAASVTELALEIDYQTGAAPFTQGGTRLDDPWTLFQTNADALFAGHKTVTVPHTLDGMEELTDITGEDFDVAAIRAIAERHRDDAGSASRRVFYVVFLDGWFADAEGRQDNVLGVSLGDSGIIAMFKPVVTGGPLVEAFVEQTTLVHEFGHAIGLVANGVATTGDHHDAEHGAHCTQRQCVMYYLNEGASDMVPWVVANVTGGDTIVFGQECRADVAAALASGMP